MDGNLCHSLTQSLDGATPRRPPSQLKSGGQSERGNSGSCGLTPLLTAAQWALSWRGNLSNVSLCVTYHPNIQKEVVTAKGIQSSLPTWGRGGGRTLSFLSSLKFLPRHEGSLWVRKLRIPVIVAFRFTYQNSASTYYMWAQVTQKSIWDSLKHIIGPVLFHWYWHHQAWDGRKTVWAVGRIIISLGLWSFGKGPRSSEDKNHSCNNFAIGQT